MNEQKVFKWQEGPANIYTCRFGGVEAQISFMPSCGACATVFTDVDRDEEMFTDFCKQSIVQAQRHAEKVLESIFDRTAYVLSSLNVDGWGE